MKKYFLILAFILLCFVFLTGKAQATTQDYAITTINTSYQSNLNFVVPDYVYSKYLQLYNDYGSTHYIRIFQVATTPPQWRFNLVNKADNPNFYFIYYFGSATQTGVYGTTVGSFTSLNGNDNYNGVYDESTHTWSFYSVSSSNSNTVSYTGSTSFGNYSYPHVIPLYSNYDSLKIVFPGASYEQRVNFVEWSLAQPIFMNLEDTTNFDITQLSKGEANTLYVNSQGVSTWVFSIIDETLQEINGGQDLSSYACSYVFSEDSNLEQFYQGNNIFGFPVSTLPFPISNYHTYAFYIDYLDSSGATQTKEFHVTMDFSTLGVQLQDWNNSDRIENQYLNYSQFSDSDLDLPRC